jgi:hypothetical protein
VHALLAARLGAHQAHLGHGEAVRLVTAGQHPGDRVAAVVAARPDDHVVGAGGLDELVEAGAERPGDRHQLVDRDAPVPRLDAAQRRRAQLAPGGEGVKRPAAGHPQAADAGADDGVERVLFLLHWQDVMPLVQASPTVDP